MGGIRDARQISVGKLVHSNAETREGRHNFAAYHAYVLAKCSNLGVVQIGGGAVSEVQTVALR